jgi:hypothetical protein
VRHVGSTKGLQMTFLQLLCYLSKGTSLFPDYRGDNELNTCKSVGEWDLRASPKADR